MSHRYEINAETLQDCINFSLGLFNPLKGFMGSADYNSVVEHMCLADGNVWTIPLTLDVDYDTFTQAVASTRLTLTYNHKPVAYIDIEDCFQVDFEIDLKKVFKTSDIAHPGVAKESGRHQYRIGGPITVTDKSLHNDALSPVKTKAFFDSKGWKTVAGFQTRNPIHKAHEYLQRVALEQCEGLFINPLVGWKKVGDFSEAAVVDGYKAMIKEYYVDVNIHLDTLRTPMLYAGPREAIFHAIIRRNLGCTHFIIGRDHAGVGDYYGKYEAHELANKIIKKYDLGIELLLLKEPFYCHKCAQIVSENTCGHKAKYVEKISGTIIRDMLAQNKRPNELSMRAEVADAIIKLGKNKFIRS
jgi:sulfate adenylyltransferase